jgi:hypothetical protein
MMIWGKLKVAYFTAYMAACKHRLPKQSRPLHREPGVEGAHEGCLNTCTYSSTCCQLLLTWHVCAQTRESSTPSNIFPPAQLGIRRKRPWKEKGGAARQGVRARASEERQPLSPFQYFGGVGYLYIGLRVAVSFWGFFSPLTTFESALLGFTLS